jgi:hypothetical protein
MCQLIAAVQAGLRYSTGLLRTREQLLALAVRSLSGVCLRLALREHLIGEAKALRAVQFESSSRARGDAAPKPM